MTDFITVTGIVIKTMPVGEYDRRIVLLTKERGKISAFAKGSRRPGNSFMAPSNVFSFGEFKLVIGKSSYNLMEAKISNYFEGFREDFEAAYYGMYFLEIADFYGRENNDERELLKLVYQSLRAVTETSIDRELIQYIYEIKVIAVNGEFPGIPTKEKYLDSTRYAILYIVEQRIAELYTFTVSNEVLCELQKICSIYRKLWDKSFKSLEIIEEVRYNSRHV